MIKRILVGLDLSSMDDMLIEYAANFAQMVEAEKVIFIHIAKDLTLPKDLLNKYPDLLAPLDESFERDIKSKIEKHFKPKKPIETEVEIREGDPTKMLLKWIKIKEVDLAIFGKKRSLKGKGIIAGKIAKTTHSSVLFVPEDTTFGIKKIVVPIDFSEHAKMALKQALHIAKRNNAKAMCLNVYDIPTGYSKIGKSFEDFADIMLSHAKRDYEEFLQNVPNDENQEISCDFIMDNNHDPVQEILEFVIEKKADFIILGSKGRSGAAAMLMGSIAERLSDNENDVPIMIIKKKGENLSFIEALFKI